MGQWSSGMIPASGAGGRGFDSPLAPFADQAFLAQMVERWPFKPMVVGSIPTEGVTLLVGVVGNISACHADAPGSIPGRGALIPHSLVGQDTALSLLRPGFKSRWGNTFGNAMRTRIDPCSTRPR